ncbi:MAG: hypothetical protein ABWY82_15955 [Tardiphaga sp.]
MFIIGIILSIAAAVFYAAGVNSAGWAIQVCRYGDVFCLNPSWLVIAAVLSLVWACFLRVDRM